jgi:UDP-N-acetyl-D-mannosaminuronate dehydrogenase
MSDKSCVMVVGLGEVGKPLLQLVSRHHRAIGVDLAVLTEEAGEVTVLHVCYPFQIKDFVGETARYIERFNPKLTIINSTVAVGTTRRIANRTGAQVVNSPVRGKHTRMLDELQHYTKFIGAIDPGAARVAAEHFQSLGLGTRVLSCPEATELAKLCETTYFGLLIAWAQEIERYCDTTGTDYEQIVSFCDEVKFLPPVRYFPGIIGGHCVLPNIDILKSLTGAQLLEAVHTSNRMKIQRDALLKRRAAPVVCPEGVTS